MPSAPGCPIFGKLQYRASNSKRKYRYLLVEKIEFVAMDIRFLESFIAVVDHGSLVEASRRLGVTPAAVAQRIHALEQEIGAALLTRIGRGVHPTEAGQAIIERGRQIVADARDLRNLATTGVPAGEIRIGAISTALTGLLPSALMRMVEVAPDLDVYLLPGTSADLYRNVIDGSLDAAVLAQPPFVLPKTSEWQALRTEPLIVLAPASAAGRDAHELLRTERFIRYDKINWGGRLADGYLRQAGIRPRERLEMDSLEAIAIMVDAGLGVSLVPNWAPPWPEGLSLFKAPLPACAPHRKLGIVWQRASPNLRLVTVAVNALKASAAVVDMLD